MRPSLASFRGVFVAGTDTGVGKTAVACAILAALRERGLHVAPFKPVESGFDGDATAWPPDAACLANAADGPRGAGAVPATRRAGSALVREDVVPYVLRAPLAPAVGAPREGVTIAADRLDAAFDRLAAHYDAIVVEGAGGLAVPVTPELLVSDLAARWQLPVVLVGRAGLGTINHTLLSVEHARARGLDLRAIVLNGMPPAHERTPAEATNAQALRDRLDVPVFVLPRVAGVDVDAGRWQPLWEAVRGKPAFERLIDALQGTSQGSKRAGLATSPLARQG